MKDINSRNAGGFIDKYKEKKEAEAANKIAATESHKDRLSFLQQTYSASKADQTSSMAVPLLITGVALIVGLVAIILTKKK